jgi:transposase
MIPTEQIAEIRRLYYAEHWKIGTIAAQLGLHPDTVRAAVATDSGNRPRTPRPRVTDPYLPFIRETLERYPALRATRIYEMIRQRGYLASVVQVRRLVARLRPRHQEAFLLRRTFPGEEAQVDWAHFGEVTVGRARRRLSCFVMTLSYSRALALEFFFDQRLENFLRGHVRAFDALGGVARTLLIDNLRSAVLERRGDAVRLHPRLIELCAHYHCAAHAWREASATFARASSRHESSPRSRSSTARPGRGATRSPIAASGRAETAARWRKCSRRRSPGFFLCRCIPSTPTWSCPSRPARPSTCGKTIYVRFDLNHYSIPPEAVGRTLTLVASDTQVRILDGTRVIASHHRSYDRNQLIVDPAHQEALLALKRKALGATPSGRLLAAAPDVEHLLEAAVARGEPASTQTIQLRHLTSSRPPWRAASRPPPRPSS